MVHKSLFSSHSDEWTTPQDFFEKLNSKYSFVCDLSATLENSKCNFYFSKEENSLNIDWFVRVGSRWAFCNPPYSLRDKFVEKAYNEMLRGARVVMLLPSRTDTKAFHNFVYDKKGVSIEFIKGRLKFGGSKNSAPFPNMLVIFDGEKALSPENYYLLKDREIIQEFRNRLEFRGYLASYVYSGFRSRVLKLYDSGESFFDLNETGTLSVASETWVKLRRVDKLFDFLKEN